MDQELTCCLCKTQLTVASQPRMMPYCQHSSCTPCLKLILTRKEQCIIICQHCGHEEQISQLDIEYFPKNISLTKHLRQKSKVVRQLTPIVASNAQLSRDTQDSSSGVERESCQVHKKELDIICMVDHVKLCPHCALFGAHRDHKIKPLNQIQQLMKEKDEQFKNYLSRKHSLDCKIKSPEFKEGVIKKIGQQKDRLISDVKLKFAQIYENIKLSEKKVYEDVIKNFKAVYARISALIKEENDAQKKYQLWELKCTELFQQGQKIKSIEEKVALYFDGPLEICSEGESLLNRIEAKVQSNISSIEVLISKIKISEDLSVADSIFNYINVFIEEDEDIEGLGFVHQEDVHFQPLAKDLGRKGKIQFGLDHLACTQDLSPINKRNSASKERQAQSGKRSSGKQPSDQRGSVEKMVEEFCSRENLDTLDLTGYSLSNEEICDILKYLRTIKKIKGLKLVKNRLSNEGLVKILEFIPSVTNLNLAFNQLSDDALINLLSSRPKVPQLRIINLSNNKINQRKAKSVIDELKKQGLIVTI